MLDQAGMMVEAGARAGAAATAAEAGVLDQALRVPAPAAPRVPRCFAPRRPRAAVGCCEGRMRPRSASSGASPSCLRAADPAPSWFASRRCARAAQAACGRTSSGALAGRCGRAAAAGAAGPPAAAGAHLAPDGHVLSGKHGRVGGGLVAVGLHLHATGHAHDGLTARQIGHVDEGVVEAGEDVSHAEDLLAIAGGGTDGHILRLSATAGLLRCHFDG